MKTTFCMWWRDVLLAFLVSFQNQFIKSVLMNKDVVMVLILRFNWNSSFYKYNHDELEDSQFNRLLYFYIISFVVEFSHTLLVDFVLRWKFKVQSHCLFPQIYTLQVKLMELGTMRFWERNFAHLLFLLLAVHVVQDSYLALLKYK